MYVRKGITELGCHVSTVAIGHDPSVTELQELSGKGITICVTSDEGWVQGPKSACAKTLKKAGFRKLITYHNHSNGHSGNLCSLWAKIDKEVAKKAKKVVKRKVAVKAKVRKRNVSVAA